ncbi:MAG: hypothetical protein ABW076_09300 [Candidatus Thiodiazotropha sp.]
MARPDITVLGEFIATHPEPSQISSLVEEHSRVRESTGQPSPESWIRLYEAATDLLEARIWQEDFPDRLLDLHRRLYDEMESGLRRIGAIPRHRFCVVIPVADRPRQLHHALSSLLTLYRRFAYAAAQPGEPMLRVMIADDSREPEHQRQIRRIARDISQTGLETEYFGPESQLRLLESLDHDTLAQLHGIFGPIDPSDFTHKGASITRNLSLLKLNPWLRASPERLLWFLDSDQAFCIPRRDDGTDCYPIHYLHQIDRVFRERECVVLTGKVVGDPPVSPAVMSGNFLDDVNAFLARITRLDAQAPCGFHAEPAAQNHDAAYHDMPDLFGFQQARESFRYACDLRGPHDNQACLVDFTARLRAFFDGVHPTRQTHYIHEPLMRSVKAARTVYTGNYVINAQALDCFIPFATLGLRMAGPTLGRILQTVLGEGFVSANLPLLHRRALAGRGRAEFRSGIEQRAQRIDLSGEFIRQYYGDIMLFTIHSLTGIGYPDTRIPDTQIHAALQQTETSMQANYRDQRQRVVEKIEALDSWLETHRDSAQISPARESLQALVADMRHNFGAGAAAYRWLDDEHRCEQQRTAIFSAIRDYAQDKALWRKVLISTGTQP